jgi:XTP/dITP diphosphohydrolase
MTTDGVIDDSPAGRIVFLSTSPRVALGLMSWPAWETLRAADVVFAQDEEHPQLPYIEQAAGSVVTVGVEEAADTVADRLLAAAAEPGRVVVWLNEDEEFDERLASALGNRLTKLMGTEEAAPELEVLPGSYDLPGSQLLDLVDVMNRLRSPGGCPWDAEQTHDSLKKYLLEETYEVLESIEEGDPETPGPGRDALVEELGDLLLQVVFHARIAEEHPEDPFSVDDVAEGIVAKLVRRHPHVFGDTEVDDAAHVAANWEANKAEEKQRESVTEGVPTAQPALSLAAKLASRARNAGLELPLPEGGDSAEGDAAPGADLDADQLGDRLLAYAVTASGRGLDPEEALRGAARRFRDRIVSIEKDAGSALAKQ